MRRIALLLLPALLAGCATMVGSPADGMGGFLGDVISLRTNPHRPVIDSDNARRITGADVQTDPLRVEDGNVWPGPLPPARTMSDMQRDMATLPPIDAPRGTAAPPASLRPAPAPAAPSARPVGAMPGGRVLNTPAGPATTTVGSNGVETYSLPDGRTGIVMPNANGTLTLIGPDGTTQTIPAPR
ncbi:MAG: hypothetical protein IT555_07705 [Acetobacteraceae bacterium]|nr:hypothetical protein [Acetobacteraceae bacterium]